jgi:hypothetical protein
MKKSFFSLLAACLLLFSACKKESNDNMLVTRTNLSLSGAQEVPAVTTTATGSMDVSYNKSTKVFSYTLRWNNLSGAPAAMHIHGPALAGVNAGVLAGISGFTAAATATHSGTVVVDNMTLKEEDLLAGKWYVNIHTAANPGGELRGQINF